MLKKTVLFLSGLLCCCGLFAQKINIKIASIAPARSPWEIEQKRLAQEWSRITNGEVNMTFYSTSALGGESAVLKKMRAVRPGQKSPLDGAILSTIGLYELAPKTDVYTLSVPFLFRSQEELDAVLEYAGEGMKQAIADEGYVVLGWFNVGWLTFYTKDPISSLDDLKKVKLSTGGQDSATLGHAFKIAGFNTEDVPSEKMLQSLKSANGVRGFFSVPMYAYAAQYSKNINYALDTSISPVLAAFVVSKSAWDSIPDRYKPELMEAVRKTGEKFVSTQKETDRQYLDMMAAEGVTLIKLEGAQREKWEEDFNKEVPKMTQGRDPLFNSEYLKTIQEILARYRAENK